MQVTVGIVAMAGWDGVFSGPTYDDYPQQIPWGLRPKVVVEVDETATLADVIDRAAAEFHIAVQPHPEGDAESTTRRVSDVMHSVWFWREGDDLPGVPFHVGQVSLPVVGEDGLLSVVDWREARLGDLVRAYERGLAPGDPTRVYLFPAPPQGDGLLIEHWGSLWELFNIYLTLAGAAFTLRDTAGLGSRLLARLKRKDDVNTEGLEQRGIGPEQVGKLLTETSLTPDQLASLLGIEPPAAEAMMELFGREPSLAAGDASDLPPDAIFMRRMIETHSGRYAMDSETPRRFAEARIEAYAAGEIGTKIEWHVGWHEIDNPTPYDRNDDELGSSSSESSSRQVFRVIPVSTDAGIDTTALEAAMNAAGAEGYSLHDTLLDQPLADGSRGHVFLFSKYIYDGDEAELAPKLL